MGAGEHSFYLPVILTGDSERTFSESYIINIGKGEIKSHAVLSIYLFLFVWVGKKFEGHINLSLN